MKNINIKHILFTSSIALLLSACGGSSSSSDTPVVTVPSCGTGTDMGKSNAVSVLGKTIVKLKDDAKVRIWHSSNEKVACMLIGNANIE